MKDFQNKSLALRFPENFRFFLIMLLNIDFNFEHNPEDRDALSGTLSMSSFTRLMIRGVYYRWPDCPRWGGRIASPLLWQDIKLEFGVQF